MSGILHARSEFFCSDLNDVGHSRYMQKIEMSIDFRYCMYCSLQYCFMYVSKVVHYSNITVYPVVKNSRDTILTFSSSILDIFFFEKYIKNARIERKVLLIWVLP